MVEAIIGNINHLSKNANLEYSCEVMVLMRPIAYHTFTYRPSEMHTPVKTAATLNDAVSVEVSF
jgi:hypothetical protein